MSQSVRQALWKLTPMSEGALFCCSQASNLPDICVYLQRIARHNYLHSKQPCVSVSVPVRMLSFTISSLLEGAQHQVWSAYRYGLTGGVWLRRATPGSSSGWRRTAFQTCARCSACTRAVCCRWRRLLGARTLLGRHAHTALLAHKLLELSSSIHRSTVEVQGY